MAERKKFWTWRRASLTGGLTAIIVAALLLGVHRPSRHANEMAMNIDLSAAAISACSDDCSLSQAGVAAYHATAPTTVPATSQSGPASLALNTLPPGMRPVAPDVSMTHVNTTSLVDSGVAAVPEPDTWMLLFFGVAAVGASMRVRPAARNQPKLARAPARIRRRG
ncbi:MAG TPA: PEP-CTERM sorting domain-containing protein [Caulobacteraceae bacterium]|jgi:hypothetical protein|nr:PEP-CTERM sorting domain-containing protein [Caulobacteraceae bacterium]